MTKPIVPPLRVVKKFGKPIFTEDVFEGRKPPLLSLREIGANYPALPKHLPLAQRPASSSAPVRESEIDAISGDWLRGQNGVFVRAGSSPALLEGLGVRVPTTAANNVIEFPRKKYNIMNAVDAKKAAMAVGYGIGAVVMLRESGDPVDPMSWGMVVNVSDILRDGKVKPIAVVWMRRKDNLPIFYEQAVLIVVHEAKSPQDIIRKIAT